MEAINQLVEKLLNSDYGKSLLKTNINLSEITRRIGEITDELNGFDPFSENKGTTSTRAQRKQARQDARDNRRQSRVDNLNARLEESNLDPEEKKTRLRKELILLKQQ